MILFLLELLLMITAPAAQITLCVLQSLIFSILIYYKRKKLNTVI